MREGSARLGGAGMVQAVDDA
ncbi:hypothetical protein OOU_Y34scaffold00301g59 [Pyricularia oryzae Y34]|uniref:Uncharacterized protein n=3 Tax=Pyricularia oryzae TaxID=318829 RepID=Q2KFV1_PYRO7|nr:hypothetical protein MGCH7_ch7g584 [Pyricularia oryzae 70-15]ELQ41138.1 hypothetical protein OOU_Y34scaffold00301g59 [Pyricularia oryzae Y34]